MNPRETTEKIKTDYQEYISSILEVKDEEITQLARKTVKQTEFVKGPFLETTLPFVSGKSLKELVGEQLLSNEFSKMGDSVHYSDWKLRIHQEAALRKIVKEKRNMIVSTGTGSGKTECYLYPIFNELMREKENGTLDAGVRALLIFPMNALANDQQKKLRKLLRTYPDITFGRYTGETERINKKLKESAEEAETRIHEEYNLAHQNDTDPAMRKSIKNELMCREMMAKKPPHILLTNYAMLEYMLLRPDTAPFFDNDTAKNWRFIVIDEAHTYKGATGTEISFLLRRVKERIRHNMHDSFRCIATSATLGSEDGKEDLAKFAESLFDEPFTKEDVITTQRVKRTEPTDARRFAPAEYVELKAKVAGKDEVEKGKILYKALVKDLRLFYVYEALKNRPKKIEEVASSVFDDIENENERESALVNLIELAAAAKKDENEAALLPARYHLFVKSLEGMFVQYMPRKMVYLDRKEKNTEGKLEYSVFELANCEKCEQEYLVGKTIDKGTTSYFVQTSTSKKPEYYFISRGENDEFWRGFDEDDIIEESEKMTDLDKFHLCLSCGRITSFAAKHPLNCCGDTNQKKIVTVYKLTYRGKDNEANCCPCCGATKKGLIKRFMTANQPATFTVAKSLYDAIPPRPIVGAKKDEDDLFADDLFTDNLFDITSEISNEVVDESGRKLLIFSDNRQEAAFFAGFFEKKYLLIMWRKIILRCLKGADGYSLCITDLIKVARNEAERCGLYSLDQERLTDMTDNEKLEMAAHYVLQEFGSPDVRTGLEGLGYIQIYPDEVKLKDTFELAGLKGQDVWTLLRFMMDTLRQKGAFTYPDSVKATDDFFSPRNHYGYFRKEGSKSARGNYIFGFVPADKSPNKRFSLIDKLVADSEKSKVENGALAREVLAEVYKNLMALSKTNHVKQSTNDIDGTVYCLNYAKWNFRYMEKNTPIYRCKKCGKVYTYSINGICPEMKCDGLFEEVTAGDIRNTPYYDRLYEDSKIVPMVAREHTAQLSARTAGEYQKNFEEGKINVLSCSTTFEMGVDVGELEATFQRNVPPETANYIQRAGRAGRRTSSAAFSVTFSRRSSHDMTFFQNPAEIIAGKINAPILEVDNEKIAQRHLNSIVIAWFFRERPEFFEDNTKRIVEAEGQHDMAVELRLALEEYPESLIKSIHDALPSKVCAALGIDEWKFINEITGEDGSLTKAIQERTADIKGLRQFREGLNPDSSKADIGRVKSADRLIDTLESEKSINFLSAKGVLPKYGFPIDTVTLDINCGDNEETKKIDLSRDLRMAISEFAPPAEVVANGKVWKSYAINTVPDKSWPSYIYYVCPECKRISPPNRGMVDVTVDVNEAEIQECKSCGVKMNPKKFIIPMFGFSTNISDKPKSVGDARPKSYYATQTQFWGIDDITEKQKAESMENNFLIGGKSVHIVYSPGGKLFVLNQGTNGRGINVCPTCGYATDPAIKEKRCGHKNKYDRSCSTKSLINVALGHEFSTDILKITLPKHPFSVAVEENAEEKDEYLSVMYAILEGASKALDISRGDISGCVTANQEIILFDDTPGGSGFVKHIYAHVEEVLKAALEKVNGVCGCTEETSCYGCLRNYSNQFFHDSLSRGLAYKYINWLLNGKIAEETDQVIINEELITKENINERMIGKKNYDYEVTERSPYDTVSRLKMLLEDAEDETVVMAIKEFIQKIDGNDIYEHPFIDMPIDLKISVWPDIFWAKSKVAIFFPEKKKQYEKMSIYDWHCYLIGENFDLENVLKYIKEA